MLVPLLIPGISLRSRTVKFDRVLILASKLFFSPLKNQLSQRHPSSLAEERRRTHYSTLALHFDRELLQVLVVSHIFLDGLFNQFCGFLAVLLRPFVIELFVCLGRFLLLCQKD